MRRRKKTERMERKERGDARKRRETWPTGSCSSQLTGFAYIKPTIKFGTSGKEAARVCDFSRPSRRSSNVRRDMRKIAITRRGGDWSGKRDFSNHSIVIGERDSRWGVERCARAHAGGPLADSLGVSLGAEGPLEILSCNGVDVTPVERVQRWEDTLWKACLARPRSHP